MARIGSRKRKDLRYIQGVKGPDEHLAGAYYSVFGSSLDEYAPESIVAIHDAGGIVLPHSYDAGPELEGDSFLKGRSMGTDGAQTNQADVITDVLDAPVPTSIAISKEGEALTARLVNASNGMGLPGKPLTAVNGEETVQLTTGRGGAVHLPEGWADAEVSFVGDATAQPASSGGNQMYRPDPSAADSGSGRFFLAGDLFLLLLVIAGGHHAEHLHIEQRA